jgi:hypothetical protein
MYTYLLNNQGLGGVALRAGQRRLSYLTPTAV